MSDTPERTGLTGRGPLARKAQHNDDDAEASRGRPGRSRRGLLAGAAGALGALAAETIASAQPAAAATPPPVLLGTDNIGTTRRTAIFTTGNKEWGMLADPNTSGLGSQGVYGAGENTGVRGEAASGGIGVRGVAGITGGSPPTSGVGVAGFGAGASAGVIGTGGGNDGIGVAGNGGATNGTGVHGFGAGTGPGVIGTGAAGGVGVLAENPAGGVALKATGPAVFSRSGVLTIAAGNSSATQTGVALTAASLVLATLQQNLSGVYVRSAVPNVAGSSFTIHLSKPAPARAKVAWFIVN